MTWLVLTAVSAVAYQTYLKMQSTIQPVAATGGPFGNVTHDDVIFSRKLQQFQLIHEVSHEHQRVLLLAVYDNLLHTNSCHSLARESLNLSCDVKADFCCGMTNDAGLRRFSCTRSSLTVKVLLSLLSKDATACSLSKTCFHFQT